MVTSAQFEDIELPSGWELKPLGKCVREKLSYGINAPAIPYDGKHPAYIRITDITEDGRYDDSDRKAVFTEERERYCLREGDIVLARTGASTGKTYLYDKQDGELVYAGFLIKASVDCETNNPRFIVGQLRTSRYWAWVASTSMRSGQPGINGKEYSSFLIPVASKKEQDAIAETLSTFDTHIANLSELIEKKKGIRDGALDDLVNGRIMLDGRTCSWTETELGKVATYRKERAVTERRQYISTENMNQMFAGITPYESKEMVEGTAFCECDTLIGNIRPYLKKVWCADFSGSCSADVLVLAGNEKIVPKILYYYIANDCFINYVMTGGVKGIKMPRGDKKYILQYPILIPSEIKDQEAIAGMLGAMDKEISALETEREKMVQIREGAMDDLLTGRVRLNA